MLKTCLELKKILGLLKNDFFGEKIFFQILLWAIFESSTWSHKKLNFNFSTLGVKIEKEFLLQFQNKCRRLN